MFDRTVVMKDHTSHDVLLLCPKCHQLSNMADLGVRNRLADECDAPFTNAEVASKTIENPKLRYDILICRSMLRVHLSFNISTYPTYIEH